MYQTTDDSADYSADYYRETVTPCEICDEPWECDEGVHEQHESRWMHAEMHDERIAAHTDEEVPF